MPPSDLAWAAGFFDGEGSAGAYHGTVGGRRYPHAVLQVGQSGSVELLERFRAAVGGRGHIKGPYLRKDGRQPTYSWYAGARADVLAVAHCLLPSVGSVKRKAILAAVHLTLEWSFDLRKFNGRKKKGA